jgi:chromosome segregation ATPase
MSKRDPLKSELVSAASELDDELGRFEEGVADFKKLSLSSKKNLDRAAKMLEELALSEQAMGVQIQALVAAIQATRDRQLARVETVREKAEELKSRSTEFRELISQFEELGVGAAALNEKLKGPQPAVIDVADEIKALGAKAEQLTALSREKGFDDVTHLADGLRQQLASLLSKLSGTQAQKQ